MQEDSLQIVKKYKIYFSEENDCNFLDVGDVLFVVGKSKDTKGIYISVIKAKGIEFSGELDDEEEKEEER